MGIFDKNILSSIGLMKGLPMDDFSTFKEVIEAWPSRRVFADDIGVSIHRVHKWIQNESIPAPFMKAIVAAGRQRHVNVTAETLVSLSGRVALGGETEPCK